MERLGALTGRGAAIDVHLRGEDGRRDADFEDVVSFVADDEVLEGLSDAARGEIGEIRAALARIEAGTWGTCERCGDPIAPRRLEVVPHARHCVRCAAAIGSAPG
ncbi:MAG: TraR/DksA family transcriptional regulator [Myxococcota bacterium]